jgi:hypothetical protein
MSTTDSNITVNFPTPELTPIASDTTPPTYTTLQVLQKELNANAASVHSNAGGGLHGHLALTMTPAEYLVIAGEAFQAPAAPPVNPVFAAGAAGPIITEANRQHLENIHIFQRYHNVDKALVRLIIAACPPSYINALSDPVLGFASVTCLQMLTHLKTMYGRITMAEKEANQIRMAAPWTPPTSIELLFLQLLDGQRLATAAGEPINDAQLARLGYSIIFNTGLFSDACRDWRLKPDADQTFAMLQSHFRRMNMDRLETTTMETAGYHGANAVVPNMQLAPTEFALLMAELKLLRIQAQANNAAQAPRPFVPRTDTMSYCWSHGTSRNPNHTSATCNHKQPGHQDHATLANQMGGSTFVWNSSHSRRGPTAPSAAPMNQQTR